jgi:predicted transcriptional regulator
MSEREIAEALGISRSSVQVYIKRGLKKMARNAALRRALEDARDAKHRDAVENTCHQKKLSHVE